MLFLARRRSGVNSEQTLAIDPCLFLDFDCSFEAGWCGWRNLESVLSGLMWGEWQLYPTSNQTFSTFRAQEFDVNFANGHGEYMCICSSIFHKYLSTFHGTVGFSVGHYLLAGDTAETSCWTSARNKPSEEAVLSGPQVRRESNLCSVTFYYFHTFDYYDRG